MLGGQIAAGAARADIKPADAAYLTDARNSVVMSGYELCWHTGTGPAPISTIECDPNFVPAPVAKVIVKPTPEPVVVAVVTPEPVVVAVVTPKPVAQPVIERVTLKADALFDFDRAVLRPAGRASLDDFVARIKGIDPEMIMVIGHTDHFGSEAYNQRLSEQRVEAVKAHLVSQGIRSDRVQTTGKGETQPVTKAGECDSARSVKSIACLQPDRRVEIEVAGTRIAR